MALERLKAALTKRPMDRDLQQLIHDVDACFGTGFYLVGDAGSYPDTESFEREEGLKIDRLGAFLSCFGDIELNRNGILLQDLIDEDPLLAFCALQQATGTATPLLGVISKMAVFYARHDDAVIPVCLRAGGVGG